MVTNGTESAVQKQENENKQDIDWVENRLGVKHDDGKARFDLIPPRAMMAIAEIYAYGALKYAERNWEHGMQWGRVYAAIQRHLHAFWSGEIIDPESGKPHLAHAAFGILALLEYTDTHPEMDDRCSHLDEA